MSGTHSVRGLHKNGPVAACGSRANVWTTLIKMTLSFFNPRFVQQRLILHFLLHRITCKHATVEIMMADCRYYGVSTVS